MHLNTMCITITQSKRAKKNVNLLPKGLLPFAKRNLIQISYKSGCNKLIVLLREILEVTYSLMYICIPHTRCNTPQRYVRSKTVVGVLVSFV